MKIRFSKNNYAEALETAYFCISERYTQDMTYKGFREQLKEDRSNGLLKDCKFEVDLRANYLLDLYEYE